MELARIQEALQEAKLDGWLFFDHHHRDALAYRILGVDSGTTVSRRWYYFIPAIGEPAGLLHRIEAATLNTLPGSKEVYSGWSTQVDGLRRLLAGVKRLAMQYSPLCAIPTISMVDAGTIEQIRGFDIDVVSSAELIQLFEARWTPDQLEMHLEAGRRVDRIRAAAFQRIADGIQNNEAITEWDIQRFIRQAFERDGMTTDHGPIVAVNENMSDPHYEPSAERSRRIQKNDAVLIDMWAKLDRPRATYYDITWTGFCGSAPPDRLVEIFETARDARNAAVQCVKSAIAAGNPLCGFEVDDAARSYVTQEGFGEFFVHRTGHSIGEEVHGAGANMDNLETHDERRIIPRTCFSVEPGIYLPEFGIRSEVNVYVDENEARVTGEAQEKLVSILP